MTLDLTTMTPQDLSWMPQDLTWTYSNDDSGERIHHTKETHEVTGAPLAVLTKLSGEGSRIEWQVVLCGDLVASPATLKKAKAAAQVALSGLIDELCARKRADEEAEERRAADESAAALAEDALHVFYIAELMESLWSTLQSGAWLTPEVPQRFDAYPVAQWYADHKGRFMDMYGWQAAADSEVYGGRAEIRRQYRAIWKELLDSLTALLSADPAPDTAPEDIEVTRDHPEPTPAPTPTLPVAQEPAPTGARPMAAYLEPPAHTHALTLPDDPRPLLDDDAELLPLGERIMRTWERQIAEGDIVPTPTYLLTSAVITIEGVPFRATASTLTPILADEDADTLNDLTEDLRDADAALLVAQSDRDDAAAGLGLASCDGAHDHRCGDPWEIELAEEAMSGADSILRAALDDQDRAQRLLSALRVRLGLDPAPETEETNTDKQAPPRPPWLLSESEIAALLPDEGAPCAPLAHDLLDPLPSLWEALLPAPGGPLAVVVDRYDGGVWQISDADTHQDLAQLDGGSWGGLTMWRHDFSEGAVRELVGRLETAFAAAHPGRLMGYHAATIDGSQIEVHLDGSCAYVWRLNMQDVRMALIATYRLQEGLPHLHQLHDHTLNPEALAGVVDEALMALA